MAVSINVAFQAFKLSVAIAIPLFLSSCSALDVKPWSTQDIINGGGSSTITGNTTSYGNQATCNQYKRQCGTSYREWTVDGEIACSCVID